MFVDQCQGLGQKLKKYFIRKIKNHGRNQPVLFGVFYDLTKRV